MEYKIGDKVKIKLSGSACDYTPEKYQTNNRITEIIKIDRITLAGGKDVYYMKNFENIPFLSNNFEAVQHKSRLDTFLHTDCEHPPLNNEVMK